MYKHALNSKATILKLVFRFSALNQSQIVLGNGQEPNGLNKTPAVREGMSIQGAQCGSGQ